MCVFVGRGEEAERAGESIDRKERGQRPREIGTDESGRAGVGGGRRGRLWTQEGANHGEEEDSVLEVDKVTSQALPALRLSRTEGDPAMSQELRMVSRRAETGGSGLGSQGSWSQGQREAKGKRGKAGPMSECSGRLLPSLPAWAQATASAARF